MSYLDDGRNPFPILERTPDLDLEHSEDMNERTTPVSDHVADRTIIYREFPDPLLRFNHFLNDLPPFVLQIVNFRHINEEFPLLQFYEETCKDLPDWPRHPFRAAEGQILCNMIRGRGSSRGKKKVQRISHQACLPLPAVAANDEHAIRSWTSELSVKSM